MGASGLRVGGVVLCGGRSRRMGASKAWLPCGREYLLQRVVRIAGGVVSPIVVAARRGQALPPLGDDSLVEFDAIEDGGPLAGMAAGFDVLATSCEAAFVVSCDQPLLRRSVIVRLIELLADHPAVVPEHQGRLHPLTAVYRLETRSVLSQALERGDFRVQDFIGRCGAHILAAEELTDADPDLSSLCNANDREAYERMVRSLPD